MTDHRLQATVPLPLDYRKRAPASGDARHCYLLLHGYTETGRKIFRLLESALPADALVLAPNGIFPMPKSIANVYELRCAWCFYDGTKDEYLIDMEPAIAALSQLIQTQAQSSLGPLPLTIIGFSQGGYLAPFLGERLPAAVRVIGIGARFLDEELKPGPHSFEMIGIHGKLDDVIDCALSKQALLKLNEAGNRTQWHELPSIGHEISPEVSALIKALVSGD